VLGNVHDRNGTRARVNPNQGSFLLRSGAWAVTWEEVSGCCESSSRLWLGGAAQKASVYVRRRVSSGVAKGERPRQLLIAQWGATSVALAAGGSDRPFRGVALTDSVKPTPLKGRSVPLTSRATDDSPQVGVGHGRGKYPVAA